MPNTPTPEKKPRPGVPPKTYPLGLRTIMELFDIGPGVALGALGTAAVIVAIAIYYFIHTAPPKMITISTGPEGSNYYKNAQKYAKILEKNGVQVAVRTSDGSLDNLKKLADPKSPVDVAFVQAGLSAPGTEDLVSLGSVSYQPMLIFYRGPEMGILSTLAGKRVAVGLEGSGTHLFAMKILEANGIKEGGPTQLLKLDAVDAAKELEAGKLDAAFIMSESASTDILHNLLRSRDVHLYSFRQGSAYSRKIEFLNLLDLPEGAIDFGLDIPAHDVTL